MARETMRRPAGLHLLLIFTRPRQWPILTCQLAVGALSSAMAARALGHGLGPTGSLGWVRLITAWLAWVVGLNGGTLAFNSAYDRDTGRIAYLPHPPVPPRWLARASLGQMLAGAALAWWTEPGFGLITTTCVGLSILYSHPAVRWKGVAGLDLAVNMIGYGAGTTLAGLVVGQAVFQDGAAASINLDAAGWLLALAFALLFGSFYPLTQLYQVEPDRRRGDRTLAGALGRRRSLVLALILGGLATDAFWAAAERWRPEMGAGRAVPALLTVALLLWLAHLAWWVMRSDRLDPAAQERGMYRALALWAVIDLTLLAQRYGVGWIG